MSIESLKEKKKKKTQFRGDSQFQMHDSNLHLVKIFKAGRSVALQLVLSKGSFKQVANVNRKEILKFTVKLEKSSYLKSVRISRNDSTPQSVYRDCRTKMSQPINFFIIVNIIDYSLF